MGWGVSIAWNVSCWKAVSVCSSEHQGQRGGGGGRGEEQNETLGAQTRLSSGRDQRLLRCGRGRSGPAQSKEPPPSLGRQGRGHSFQKSQNWQGALKVGHAHSVHGDCLNGLPDG